MAGLAAKISKADGAVSENEIRTFKKLFNTDKNPKIARIFNEAKQSTAGYQAYAKQLKILSRDNLDMKESIIENLFKIAVVDGEILSDEMEMHGRYRQYHQDFRRATIPSSKTVLSSNPQTKRFRITTKSSASFTMPATKKSNAVGKS